MSNDNFGTMDEWIDALEEMMLHGTAEDGFYTRAELSAHFNQGRDTMLARLHKLAAEGRLEIRSRVATNIAGRRHSYPVYRLIPAQPAKKARRKK